MIKMTYPGIVLLVGVGVGLATFLYYMFAESSHEHEREQQHQQHGSSRNRSSYDDWGVSSHRSEKTVLNRRSSSTKRWTEEGRDGRMSKDDINYCSICQDIITDSNARKLHPCKHIFHKDCINKLRNLNPMAPCPNCRKPIEYISSNIL